MVVQANAEIEATPVPLQVSSSSKDEGLEKNSTMEADVEAFGGKREFKFVEFFAGMGGLFPSSRRRRRCQSAGGAGWLRW